MKKLFLCLFIFGCGDPSAQEDNKYPHYHPGFILNEKDPSDSETEDVERDTSDAGVNDVEKIYRNGEYGAEFYKHVRCTAVAEYCLGPKSKVINYTFHAGTCSSWWQGRFFEAMNGLAEAYDVFGWTITSTTAVPFNLELRCGSTGPEGQEVGLGASFPRSIAWTTLPNGIHWGQPQKYLLYIDSAQFEASAAWPTASDAKRQNVAENTIRHEVGHSLGLGHGGTGTVMEQTYQMTNSNAWPWSFGSYYTLTENGWLHCYDPTTDTVSNC